MELNDPSLLETRAYVNGTWLPADKTFSVINPANGDQLAQVADLEVHNAVAAIEAAHATQAGWASRTGKKRAQILRRWFDLMVANADDLATILTAEMGKPWHEARAEILYGAGYIEWFAEEAKRVYGDIIPGHQADKRLLVLKQPVGVVGAITPWNFPNAMIARKAAPALAVGCTFLVRPAEQTPLSALAMAVLADRARIPPGVFNVLPSSDPVGLGQELCSNPKVAKISFTGSTRVGKVLMRQCSDTIKKLSLELGGNAPFIVFDDADVDAAVEGAMIAKFRNSGQTCVCANRFLVQSGIHDEFARKFAAKVQSLRPGDGFEHGVTIGPLIDEAAVAKVETHVADAVEKGARILEGGRISDLGGTFYAPTVLTGTTPEMLIAAEETFGPVAPITRFETEAQVVSLANDTEFGLAAYFYSRDLSRVWRVAEALECGMVGINTGLISTEVAPFGGIQQSGIGREGSKYGCDDYLNIKYLCVAV